MMKAQREKQKKKTRHAIDPLAATVSIQERAAAPLAVFPHQAQLRQALGHDVPGQAQVDPAICAQRGVPAFTDGTTAYFANEQPDLHVAAHEATHLLQHSGRTHDAGMGAEGHADAVATEVVEGRDANSLIGPHGENVAPSVRNYTKLTKAQQKKNNDWNVGSFARVADDGRAVKSHKRRDCWADPQLIQDANKKLKALESGIEITGDSSDTVAGNAPDGSGRKVLQRVVPTIKAADNWGDDNFWADCGRSSREVMGPHGKDKAPRGVYNDQSGKKATTESSYDPAHYRDQIYMKGGLGKTPREAREAYRKLSKPEKQKFDQKHGINKYAAPDVGEAYVSRRDDEMTSKGFNWHWGGVIMVTGHDRVTLENFAKPGTNYNTKDTEWYFEMYGPANKKGQTFHEQNEGSVGDKGKNNTTMAARTS